MLNPENYDDDGEFVMLPRDMASSLSGEEIMDYLADLLLLEYEDGPDMENVRREIATCREALVLIGREVVEV